MNAYPEKLRFFEKEKQNVALNYFQFLCRKSAKPIHYMACEKERFNQVWKAISSEFKSFAPFPPSLSKSQKGLFSFFSHFCKKNHGTKRMSVRRRRKKMVSGRNLCGRSILVKRNAINKAQSDDAATKIENL